MNENKLELLENAVNRSEEIKNSYKAIVEKISQLIMEIDGTELEELEAKINKIFADASENEKKIEEIHDDLEMEKNKVRMEA